MRPGASTKRTKLAACIDEKEPFAPHASGKGPLSRFELTISPISADSFAQAGGSVLQTT